MAHKSDTHYRTRLVEPLLEQLLAELPAVLLVGPRAAGKTTTAQRHAATTIRLDHPTEGVAFRADPDAALRGLKEPVLLDEWQAVPEVLGAVKRAVDTDWRPGRFLLTGSVHADLEQQTWPGTGRLIRVMLPALSVRELEPPSPGRPLLERLKEEGLSAAETPVENPPDLRGYLQLLLRSGFPEPALRLGGTSRQAWLDSYVKQLLTRDVASLDPGRDPERLRRYLTAYAAVTAQVVDDKTIWEAAGINKKTSVAYERLLENLFVVHPLPAFSDNLLRRLVYASKRLVADPAVAAALLRQDEEALIRQGPLMGALLETFVVSQLRAEAAASVRGPRLHHLRTKNGRQEVDVIVEYGYGPQGLLGIEVKASSAPRTEDAKHLRWLQDTLGGRFMGGLVLHTGHRTYRLGPDIVAAPIALLWN